MSRLSTAPNSRAAIRRARRSIRVTSIDSACRVEMVQPSPIATGTPDTPVIGLGPAGLQPAAHETSQKHRRRRMTGRYTADARPATQLEMRSQAPVTQHVEG